MKKRVLAIDDDPTNLKLIKAYLPGEDITTAESGEEGWDIIAQNYRKTDIVLLDRMMPGMNGMDFMQKHSEHPEISKIPVVMQTAAGSKEQVAEGVRAGVFYYLVKPYDDEVLKALVDSAVEKYRLDETLRTQLAGSRVVQSLTNSCSLSIQTRHHVEEVSLYLAACYPDPNRVVVGIRELLFNAIEHGNLGISFDDKTQLLCPENPKAYFDEIDRRLSLPENEDKRVDIEFEKTDTSVVITIKDEGKGFNWKNCLAQESDALMQTHGRGIPMCRHLFFDKLEYLGNGNEVRATINK